MEKIKVEVIVKNNIKEAWNKWVSPKNIKEWCHASDDWSVGEVLNDISVGGRFLTNMHAIDNSASFNFEGTYKEIDEYKKIVYIMDKSENEEYVRECEILFEEINEKETKVTEIFDSESVNSIEMQKAGWQSILDNFKKHCEK